MLLRVLLTAHATLALVLLVWWRIARRRLFRPPDNLHEPLRPSDPHSPPRGRRAADQEPMHARDAQDYLRARDAAEAPLKPQAVSRIIWAGRPHAVTDVALVFLHGWSTSPLEVDPVDARVAERLGANLVRLRLTGHGLAPESRAGRELVRSATREALLRDAAVALALGKLCGRRVVLMGSSTGGSLALWLAAQPWARPDVAGVVLISPGLKLALHGPQYALLKWPVYMLPAFLSRAIIHAVGGPVRAVEYISEEQTGICTMFYPTESVCNICKLYLTLEVAVDAREICAPVLVFANPRDHIVSYEATREFLRPTTHRMVDVCDSEEAHIITGRVHSPSTVPRVVAASVDWLREVLALDDAPGGGGGAPGLRAVAASVAWLVRGGK